MSLALAIWLVGGAAGMGRAAGAGEPGIELLPLAFTTAAAETAGVIRPAAADTSVVLTPSADTSSVAKPTPASVPTAKIKPKRATKLGAGVGAAIGLAAGVVMVQGLNPGDSVLGFNLYAGPVVTTLLGGVVGGIVGWFFQR
jgi:hypothetical protein